MAYLGSPGVPRAAKMLIQPQTVDRSKVSQAGEEDTLSSVLVRSLPGSGGGSGGSHLIPTLWSPSRRENKTEDL